MQNKGHDYLFKSNSTPETVWIPISNPNRVYKRQELYELSDIFSRAVRKKNSLITRIVEHASRETSRYDYEMTYELISMVREYLVNFVLSMPSDTRQHDPDDLYTEFKSGLKKILRRYDSEGIKFIQTTHHTSNLSSRSQQDPAYKTPKRELEDYTNYW